MTYPIALLFFYAYKILQQINTNTIYIYNTIMYSSYSMPVCGYTHFLAHTKLLRKQDTQLKR